MITIAELNSRLGFWDRMVDADRLEYFWLCGCTASSIDGITATPVFCYDHAAELGNDGDGLTEGSKEALLQLMDRKPGETVG